MRPMRRTAVGGLVAGLALVLTVATAMPQSAPWTRQDAMHEASSEASQCFAFYGITKKCMENSGQPTSAAQAQRAMERASRLAFTTGTSGGMSNEAMLATTKLALDNARGLTNDNCVNISVLIIKYGNFCKSLLEKPDERIARLLRGPPDKSDP